MEKIPIHWLHKQAYCEYQIYLEHVMGVEAQPTAELLRGIEKHTALQEEHEEVAKLELTIPAALAKAQLEGKVLRSREVPVVGSILAGSIDEVQFMPDQVRIVEDKPGDVAYLPNRREVWGYCLAFDECYRPRLPIVAVLRNRDTGKEFWSKPFLEQHRRDVLDSITRIQRIMSRQGKGQPTKNANKCKSCRLATSCDARLEV